MRIPAQIRERSTDWVLQFINIVFLLLLYFLVNGSITEQPPREIELPLSEQKESAPPPHRALYVDQSGQLTFDGRKVSVENVAAALSGNASGQTLTVVADRRLPATILIAVLDELKQRGQFRFAIVTQADAGP